jgi:pilus assembly protein CpaC
MVADMKVGARSFWYVLEAAAVVFTLWAVPAPAAETVTAPTTKIQAPTIQTPPMTAVDAPTAVAQGEDQIQEKRYTIEVSKGRLLRLASPASAVIAADPTVADVQVLSPLLVYVNGKAVGETTILAVDSKDNEILHAVVTVTHNISKLNEAVKAMMPDAKVSFQSVDSALVMNGDVESPMQADQIRRLATPFIKANQTLVNMLHPLGSNQVMLKVKVAEVDRTATKNFGISLQNISSASSFTFGILQGRGFLNNGTVSQSTTANTIFGTYNTANNSLNGVIDALEDNGLVTTLAEPTLTTQSGQAASFLAGGEIPVPSVTGSGSTAQVSVAYQPFGVSVNFTPVVLSKDRISMQVAPEVSSLSTTGQIQDAGFTIPGLQTRKASTTVELGSGQSFVIAGLLQNDHSNDISKFPFLGDVPVLGALFRSTQFQHNQTELVIIVTPYIVGAVNSKEALRDPTQGMIPSSDAERILLGRLYKQQPPTPDTDVDSPVADKPHLYGAAGYVLK